MANTSQGFTPRGSMDAPSNKQFTCKKPGTRPFTSELSSDTPFLSNNGVDGVGHTSTKNPCRSKSSFASASFDSADGETETVIARQGNSSSHVTSRSEEPEGMTWCSNKVTSKTPQYGNRGLQRPVGFGQHGFANFDKETPFLYAIAKQNVSTNSGTNLRNHTQSLTGNVSSTYFSKLATSTFPRVKAKGKRQPQRAPVSSLTTSSVSASSEADSSIAMETETEGDMSVGDVGQLRTVERLESSVSADSQVYRIFLCNLTTLTNVMHCLQLCRLTANIF